MRSTYHVARALLGSSEGSASTSGSSFGGVDDKFWNKLWGICVPGKVKIYVWHACLDVLPTHSNICKRRVMTKDLCVICGRQVKFGGQ